MTLTKKLFLLLTEPRLLHYVLPMIMIYLIVGTISQKYLGLYKATRLFFSDIILWVHPVIPLPGMPILLGLVFLNLAFKLIFKSPWSKTNSGIIITHIGVMVLLLGGLFTAVFSREGYIALGVGESKHVISDYHSREFLITDEAGKTVYAIDHKELGEKGIIKPIGDALSIKILEHCENCDITSRQNSTDQYQGMAQHMQIIPKASNSNDEDNMAGLTFEIEGNDNIGIYTILEDVPQYPEISIGQKKYKFSLMRQQRKMPFSIRLVDLQKQSYPGTDLAKSYESKVLIEDDGMVWEAAISMNDPLRYKGYTFFQSSFLETPQGNISVLAAVQNAGRSFPYISGLILCLGILMHMSIRQNRSAGVRKNAKV